MGEIEMGRPRTPSRILEARGSFKAHPERRRDGEPVVKNPLGNAPDRVTGLALEAWIVIAERAPLGVLTSADSLHVEMTSYLLAELWENMTTFPQAKYNTLNKMLGQVGMNPIDRSKLSVAKPEKTNSFAEF
jgi:hypothetical protein